MRATLPLQIGGFDVLLRCLSEGRQPSAQSAKDKAEREIAVAEIAARLRERQQLESQIEPQPDSPALPQHDAPARPARREPKPISRLFPPPAEPPVRITIRNVPKQFPGTPLPRRW